MIIAIAWFGVSEARYHEIKRSGELERLADRYAFSVVCCAPSKLDTAAHRDQNREARQEFRFLRRYVRDASRKDPYKRYAPLDIGFFVVDGAVNKADDVVSAYDLVDFPACFVLSDRDDQSDLSIITPESSKDVIALLETQGGQDLQDLLEERKQEEDLRRQERIAAWYAYNASSPTTYWVGPYWQPYWRSPYWSGWQCGCFIGC